MLEGTTGQAAKKSGGSVSRLHRFLAGEGSGANAMAKKFTKR